MPEAKTFVPDRRLSCRFTRLCCSIADFSPQLEDYCAQGEDFSPQLKDFYPQVEDFCAGGEDFCAQSDYFAAEGDDFARPEVDAMNRVPTIFGSASGKLEGLDPMFKIRYYCSLILSIFLLCGVQDRHERPVRNKGDPR